ncbi:hypothetical protein R5W24_000467 [Gemmata sp. JC717]|uniref:hypothetical protein n=1 Tax=Gemmata algarum TaxID=2975278 RepID=UPI0021BB7F57|nr:hypothetical protein [Gemmata algarum]MDY3551391.1 hypothetical protein [Gemmata algarum]
MLGAVAFGLAFAALNRARGTHLFGTANSTQISRIVSTLAMAVLVQATTGSNLCGLWAWVTLFLWSLPGWGEYAGFAVGVKSGFREKEFAPVDWLMKHLRIKNDRLWGGTAMGLRMLLALPCALGLAWMTGGSYWPSLLLPLAGLVYVPCGRLFKAKGWGAGEHCAGAIIGAILFNSIG